MSDLITMFFVAAGVFAVWSIFDSIKEAYRSDDR